MSEKKLNSQNLYMQDELNEYQEIEIEENTITETNPKTASHEFDSNARAKFISLCLKMQELKKQE